MGQTKLTEGKTFLLMRSYSYDSHNDNPKYAGITQKDWLDLIWSTLQTIWQKGHIEQMAIILHDKDKDKHGKPAGIHFHIHVTYAMRKKLIDVMSEFEATDDKNCQVARWCYKSAQYLTHISDKALEDEKHMYGFDEVFCFNCRYRDMVKPSYWGEDKNGTSNVKNELQVVGKREEAEAIADRLGYQVQTGEIRKHTAEQQLKEQAGISWYRKLYGTFDKDQQVFINSKASDLRRNGRNLEHIYIMGHGGIGKSVMARNLAYRLANGKGVKDAAVTGKNKTPDVFEGCSDEEVLLMNEMEPSAMMPEEFKTNFDNYVFTTSSSRNENAMFVGEHMISTNSLSPLQFVKDMMVFSPGGSDYQDPSQPREINDDERTLDEYWQIRRRFTHVVILLRDEQNTDYVNAYLFKLRASIVCADGSISSHDGDHILVGHTSFKAVPNTEPEITDDFLDDIEHMMATDVSNTYNNITSVGRFLEANGMVQEAREPMLDAFIDDVVSHCVWDLLPTTFLYDLYKSYRTLYYPADKILNIREFLGKMDSMLDGWVRKSEVRSDNKMDADEPLITEYGLELPDKSGKLSQWANHNYQGNAQQDKRNFVRKAKYSGYVRL